MPSTSKKQADFMRAVAHSPEFAKKAGVPQSVGKDFSSADKGRKFSKGGDMKSENMMMKKEGRGMAKADMAKKGMPAALAKHAGMPASKAHKGLKAGGSVGTTKMGAVRTASPSRDGVATQGKTKGTPIKMARGGKAC
jgi:hypothetical protein